MDRFVCPVRYSWVTWLTTEHFSTVVTLMLKLTVVKKQNLKSILSLFSFPCWKLVLCNIEKSNDSGSTMLSPVFTPGQMQYSPKGFGKMLCIESISLPQLIAFWKRLKYKPDILML